MYILHLALKMHACKWECKWDHVSATANQVKLLLKNYFLELRKVQWLRVEKVV